MAGANIFYLAAVCAADGSMPLEQVATSHVEEKPECGEAPRREGPLTAEPQVRSW